MLSRCNSRPSARIGHQSVQEDFQRAPHRNPANDQETFANDTAETTVAKVDSDGVENRDGGGEKCQGDEETDATATKQLPKRPSRGRDPLTEVPRESPLAGP